MISRASRLILLGLGLLLVPAQASLARQLLIVWQRPARPPASGAEAPDALLPALRSALPNLQVTPLTPASAAVVERLKAGDLRPDQLGAASAESLAALGLILGADWLVARAPESTALKADAPPSWTLVRTDTARSTSLPEGSPADAVREQLAAQADVPAAQAWTDRGSAWLKQGRAQEALPYLRRAVALTPYSTPYRALLGRALRLSGHDDEATEVLRTVLREEKSNALALADLAALSLRQGHVEEARTLAERAEKTGVEDPERDLLLGQIHFAAGRNRRALEYFDLVRDRPEAWHYVAQIQYRQGDWSSAFETARRALRDAPDDVGLHRIAARSLQQLERYSEAVVERASLILAMLRTGAPRPRVDLECLEALNDTASALDRLASGKGVRGDLYRAAQESLVIADRLQSEGPDDGNATAQTRDLACKLWSQGAYDLIKSLEGGPTADLQFATDLLQEAASSMRTALRQGKGAGTLKPKA